MKKNLLAAVLFLLTGGTAFSFAPAPDSIGVKKAQGKKYILHRIEPAEGWFSIARNYGISYAQLRLANKDSSDKLIPGRAILIPLDKLKANDPHFEKNYIQDDELHYTVHEGETMFSIAKKFYTSVDSLKKWNHLADSELKSGQRLKVGYKGAMDGSEPEAAGAKNNRNDSAEAVKKVPVPLDKTSRPAIVSKPDSAKGTRKEAPPVQTKTIKTAAPGAADTTKIIRTASSVKTSESKKPGAVVTGKGRKEVFENGIASWIRDDDINPNKYYALHRTAPIGTIIKVTNKMNNKYVFVKVVGSLPNTGDNTDLVIKISKASAEKLGVRDSKFQSELSYGITGKK
jgi:LysM repeat protein